MRGLPYTPWYTADWLNSDARLEMTIAEQGIYRNLLDQLWERGGQIPASHDKLAFLAGVSTAEIDAAWPVLSKYIIPHPDVKGTLTNLRTLEELNKLKVKSEAGRVAGTASAKSRKQKRSNESPTNTPTNCQRTPQRNGNDKVNESSTNRQRQGQRTGNKSESESESESESYSTSENVFQADDFFERLWLAYPATGRRKKPLAEKAWSDLILPALDRQTLADEIMAAITGKWSTSKLWKQGFVPDLANFLILRRWQEDPEQAPPDPMDRVK